MSMGRMTTCEPGAKRIGLRPHASPCNVLITNMLLMSTQVNRPVGMLNQACCIEK